MKKILALVVVLMMVFALLPATVFAADVTDFTTLQTAISTAADGAVIEVAAGTFDFGTVLSITKNITIKGVAGTVFSKADGHYFNVNNDSVTLKIENVKFNINQGGQSVFVFGAGTLYIENCVFDNAGSATYGGNLVMNDGSGKRELHFLNNTVDVPFRNAINAIGNNSVISGNTFNVGVETVPTVPVGRTSVLSLIAPAGPVTITNNTFIGANRALAVDSSAMEGSQLTFKNNTFIDTRYAFELSPTANVGKTYDIHENYYVFGGVIGPLRVQDADSSASATSGFAAEYNYDLGGVVNTPWMTSGTEVTAEADATYTVIIPASVDFGTIYKNMPVQTKTFDVKVENAFIKGNITVANTTNPTVMKDNNGTGSEELPYTLTPPDGGFVFTADGTKTGEVSCNPDDLTAPGSYKGFMTFSVTYVETTTP